MSGDSSLSDAHREKLKLLFMLHPHAKSLSPDVGEMISAMCVKQKILDDNMSFCNLLIFNYGLKGPAAVIHEKCAPVHLLDEREMHEMKEICHLTLTTLNEVIRSEFAKEAASVSGGAIEDLDVAPIGNSEYVVVRGMVKDILRKAVYEVKEKWLQQMLLSLCKTERQEFRDMLETIVACIVNKQARCLMFGLKVKTAPLVFVFK